MPFPFQILRERTCINSDCDKRVQVSRREARLRWWLLLLRLTSMVVLAGLVGAVATLFMFTARAQVARSLPAQQTIEQFEIQEDKAEILLLRAVVIDQAKDIAMMKGIGIGLSAILLVLQIAQITVGKNVHK